MASKIAEAELDSVEKVFAAQEAVPSWKDQLTFRSFVIGFLLTILITFIKVKVSLNTEIIPSLNVCAGLLGYFCLKVWTQCSSQLPFTRQENSVIQTCVVAGSGIAFSGN
ncbi:probable metal-nicotianamine transporter YSL5 [Punica granatum]|uniref:Probable metal-nicotianamine transporter YSL5 n=1 Tax=Punica granatum TaxID=22663 RepID=A0A6P8DVK4_PUNGR|nr:probable metal-nicotianamine transporter YSL5 [Punica granatum]